ncbi:hypothetical protein C8Q74DRAFT_1280112 [Fomes fomentarius]|nr:hypothetical protein C8Q74DRAFT_1280112 [Fomes fomentarius]
MTNYHDPVHNLPVVPVAHAVLAETSGGSTGIKLPPLHNTLGALYLGTIFSIILYGCTLNQTYRYFRLYPKDFALLKGLVIILCISDTIHTISTAAACYFRMITLFLLPQNLTIGHWSTRLITPLTIITILACQSFYVHRVWMIGPRYRSIRIIVFIAIFCMVVFFGFGCAITVEGFKRDLEQFKHVTWMVSIFYGVAVLVDILLTTTLIAVLLKSRTGFRRTDSAIEVLILYSINTGLLTSIVGLVCFVFAIIIPGNLVYIGVSIIGTKLYANSVLAVLNSRRALSNRLMERFEMGSFEAYIGQTRRRPHTSEESDSEVVDMTDGARTRGQLSTHISFATPQAATENATSMNPSTTGDCKGGYGDLKDKNIDGPERISSEVRTEPKVDVVDR